MLYLEWKYAKEVIKKPERFDRVDKDGFQFLDKDEYEAHYRLYQEYYDDDKNGRQLASDFPEEWEVYKNQVEYPSYIDFYQNFDNKSVFVVNRYVNYAGNSYVLYYKW